MKGRDGREDGDRGGNEGEKDWHGTKRRSAHERKPTPRSSRIWRRNTHPAPFRLCVAHRDHFLDGDGRDRHGLSASGGEESGGAPFARKRLRAALRARALPCFAGGLLTKQGSDGTSESPSACCALRAHFLRGGQGTGWGNLRNTFDPSSFWCHVISQVQFAFETLPNSTTLIRRVRDRDPSGLRQPLRRRPSRAHVRGRYGPRTAARINLSFRVKS